MAIIKNVVSLFTVGKDQVLELAWLVSKNYCCLSEAIANNM